jgi:HEAT repeat protein
MIIRRFIVSKTIIAVFTLFLFVNCGFASDIDLLLHKLISNEKAPDMQALHELIRIGAPAVQPAVDKLNKENDQWKQQYYLILLYNIGNGEITNDILPFAESKNGNVREWAIYVLGKIGNQNSIEALVNSLSDSAVEESAKEQAVQRLQHLTGQTIPFKKSMSFEEKKSAIMEWQNYLKKSNSPS